MTTTPNTDALLPCPFCGASPAQLNMSFEFIDPPLQGDHENTLWCITCSWCGVQHDHHDGKIAAIAAWNTRTPAPSDTYEEVKGCGITNGNPYLGDFNQWGGEKLYRKTKAVMTAPSVTSEELARVLCKRSGYNPDDVVGHVATAFNPNTLAALDERPLLQWESYLDEAQAILTAFNLTKKEG